MRLLDLIAQARDPFLVEQGEPKQVRRLQGAVDLAPEVLACPLRYVLTDELAALCAELAYSSADRLARCLDLVRLPAPCLWVEWADRAALEGAAGFFGDRASVDTEPGRRVGILAHSVASGAQATLRAFWSDQDQGMACPMEALLDLQPSRCWNDTAAKSAYRQWIEVTENLPAVAQLLACARFRLEPSWADYYEQAAISESQGRSAMRDGLAGIARDVPVLLAFLLLLTSREGVVVRPVDRDAVNRKRVRNGRTPLLNHVEASFALQADAHEAQSHEAVYRGRFAPRRHHVRGHLVRRRNQVFWRRPHFRGNAFNGRVLSRTVSLSFEHGARPPA